MLSSCCMPRRPQPDLKIAKSAPAPSAVAGGGQASREGKAAITFFVAPESKDQIRAALIDGGYGSSFQKGLVALLNELLANQNRPPIA